MWSTEEMQVLRQSQNSIEAIAHMCAFDLKANVKCEETSEEAHTIAYQWATHCKGVGKTV